MGRLLSAQDSTVLYRYVLILFNDPSSFFFVPVSYHSLCLQPGDEKSDEYNILWRYALTNTLLAIELSRTATKYPSLFFEGFSFRAFAHHFPSACADCGKV